MSQGSLALVLHAHLPFVRHPEHEDFLEEDWLYEAISETYLPLLKIFDRLTDEGILDKVAYQERPARYEYRLTDKGRALFGVIAALHRWGNDWLSGEEGPPIEMVDRATGAVIKPIVVDEATGEALDPRRITVRPGPGFKPE